MQEQEAMRHGINQLSLSKRRQVEKTLKLPMYTVLIEPGCGKLLLSSLPNEPLKDIKMLVVL